MTMPRMCTFVIEGHDTLSGNRVYDLLVDDGHGEVTPIAFFVDKNAMALFTRAFDLAKMAAHEHGRNGI